MSITHVQSVNNGGASQGSGAPVSMATSGLTAGNLVIVGAYTNNVTETLTPSATGVTFGTVLGPYTTALMRIYLWVGVVNTAGATAVVVTPSVATLHHVHVWGMEFSGLRTAGHVDLSGQGTSGSGTNLACTTFTGLAQANELLIGLWGIAGSPNTITPAVNWTSVHSVTTRRAIGQWRIVNTLGSYPCDMTISNSANYASVFVSLKALDLGIVPQLHHRAMSV